MSAKTLENLAAKGGTMCQDQVYKVYKRNLHQLKQFCAQRGFETFRVIRVEICLMAIYLQRNFINF